LIVNEVDVVEVEVEVEMKVDMWVACSIVAVVSVESMVMGIKRMALFSLVTQHLQDTPILHISDLRF
jgi:purine-cytosine permease-like protein